MLKYMVMLISASYASVQYYLDIYDIPGEPERAKVVFEKKGCTSELIVDKNKLRSQEVTNWLKQQNLQPCRGNSGKR